MRRLYVKVEAVVDAEDLTDGVRRIATELETQPDSNYDLTGVLSLAADSKPTEARSVTEARAIP
jgi:hypothetical protein